MEVYPIDVLRCLNALGYVNISAQQLKEFIRDLKKLIKYEEKKEREHFAHYGCLHRSSTPISHEYEALPSPVSFSNDDIFDTLYRQSTISSNAKVVPKKPKIIEIEIKRPQNVLRPNTNLENSINWSRARIVQHTASQTDNIPVCKSATKPSKTTPKSKPQNTVPQVKKKQYGSKPRMNEQPVKKKSDPVALYHYYKNIWDQINFPGEYNKADADLRWHIRGQITKVCPRLARINI